MTQTTYDFNDGNGEVNAKRHINPNGSTGGWVSDSASVENSVHIGFNALVFGEARIHCIKHQELHCDVLSLMIVFFWT